MMGEITSPNSFRKAYIILDVLTTSIVTGGGPCDFQALAFHQQRRCRDFTVYGYTIGVAISNVKHWGWTFHFYYD